MLFSEEEQNSLGVVKKEVKNCVIADDFDDDVDIGKILFIHFMLVV